MCRIRRNPFLHQFALGQFQVSHPLLDLIWNSQSDGHKFVFLPLYFSPVNSLIMYFRNFISFLFLFIYEDKSILVFGNSNSKEL